MVGSPFEMYDCSNSLWTSSELCRLFNAQVLHFLRLTSSSEEVYLKREMEFEVEILLRVSRSCSTETDFIYMQLDPPPPGAPGMFRCAEPKMIQGLFKAAGLKQTGEKEVNSRLNLESTEVYWSLL